MCQLRYADIPAYVRTQLLSSDRGSVRNSYGIVTEREEKLSDIYRLSCKDRLISEVAESSSSYFIRKIKGNIVKLDILAKMYYCNT